MSKYTLTVDDAIWQAVKVKAATEAVTIKSVFDRLIHDWLASGPQSQRVQP